MTPRSRKKTFDPCIKEILQKYWIEKRDKGRSRWKLGDVRIPSQGEGECSARITLSDSTSYDGIFHTNSYHAEMDALVKVIKKDKLSEIECIEISSPPCDKCAVVLEIKDLSDFVKVSKKASRNGPSNNWNEAEKNSLIDIIAPSDLLSEEEIEANITNIWSYFQSDEWTLNKRRQ